MISHGKPPNKFDLINSQAIHNEDINKEDLVGDSFKDLFIKNPIGIKVAAKVNININVIKTEENKFSPPKL